MNDVAVSFGDDVAHHSSLPAYQSAHIQAVLAAVLDVVHAGLPTGLALPYYPTDADFGHTDWMALPKSLDLYVCDTDEGRTLNLEARGKDYATNVLSYPSHLPCDLCQAMGQLPLGELIICHDVVVREAAEQGKTMDDHLTHLIVHGILHLLGFDHELGQDEAVQMERLEIQILAGLGIANPYE